MPIPDKEKLHQIRKNLEEHHRGVVEHFHKKHVNTLKFAKKHSLSLVSAAILALGALSVNNVHAIDQTKQKQHQEEVNLQSFINELGPLLANNINISKEQEKVIAEALTKKFGIHMKASLEGNHLNEIFGYVGKEQHLKRWNGDSLHNHDLQNSGMAPLQGAFRDFDNAEQEKYYVAVQLHELPNWNKDWPTLKPWYRYRKVFVYNPVNQKGVVAVIGDAGPSKFTGKTFGGSPEVMDYLEMKDGAQKGKAIILFVDDSEDKIALGPVESLPNFLATKE